MDEDELRQARDQWHHRGQRRPPFAREPGPDEESVWDYPRPPALRAAAEEVRVMLAGQTIAVSDGALEVLETSHPPTVYIPPADIDWSLLTSASGSSFCEWKGSARYFDVQAGAEKRLRSAWSYPEPLAGMEALADHVSFYPARFECFFGGERVLPQAGGFYGGWVRPGIVGPFKGEPGTSGW